MTVLALDHEAMEEDDIQDSKHKLTEKIICLKMVVICWCCCKILEWLWGYVVILVYEVISFNKMIYSKVRNSVFYYSYTFNRITQMYGVWVDYTSAKLLI